MQQRSLLQTRDEIVGDLRRKSHTTFLIIGGGVHGAALARLAARNGISCRLIERSDYGAETSCRSSKMAHGGLRYLETLDLAQVSEGLRARDDLFATAPHLCRPAKFLVPVPRGDWWFRSKLCAGMWLYDRMGTDPSHRHRYLPAARLPDSAFGEGRDLDGCYEYTDGLIHDDARLVLESILDARAHGADCLNYCEAISVTKNGAGYSVACRDRISGGEFELSTDLAINCAGPWAPWIGGHGDSWLSSHVRYSAGAHLLFDRPWPGPCLFLPIEVGGVRIEGRYYFVWPHPGGGTMVGTTEREMAGPPRFDPLPAIDEIEEILGRLDRDLPDSGLNRETLYYAFAGVRTLPLRGHGGNTARLSRKHMWQWSEAGLSLLGGKLTTANWTAWEGFHMAVARLAMEGRWQSLVGARYPGSATGAELREVQRALTSRGMPLADADRLTARYGARARKLLSDDASLGLVSPHVYRGELEMALREEQCSGLDDLLRRRTGVESLPGALAASRGAIPPYLSAALPAYDARADLDTYQKRTAALRLVIDTAREVGAQPPVFALDYNP